jgi:hypothetical protein
VGVFEGDSSPRATVTGVFSYPDPRRALVVAAGAGYLVDTADPEEWDAIDIVPILRVIDASHLRLLVFHDYTSFSAWGGDGFVWRSRRVAYDGIRVTAVGTTSVEGFAWSSPREAEVPFELDLATGIHVGGDSPEDVGPRA